MFFSTGCWRYFPSAADNLFQEGYLIFSSPLTFIDGLLVIFDQKTVHPTHLGSTQFFPQSLFSQKRPGCST